MATYKDVLQDVRMHEGISVKSCWIAHVRELNGLLTREAPNRKSTRERVHRCPPSKREKFSSIGLDSIDPCLCVKVLGALKINKATFQK